MSLLTFILLLSSSLSAAASVIYKGPGDEVVISAGSGLGNIEAITWKHNEDIAVEWYGGEPSAYRHFNGHTTLDKFTGALTISGLTRNHSGFYTAEINNKVFNTTEVRVISPVPKPTVSKQCDAEMTYCTLTCEGSTTDAGPVTYSWEIFDVLNYYKGQQVNLTKEDLDPWYRCEMKNPISSETSEEFPNPFLSSKQMLIIILVLLFLFLLLIGLIVGIFIHRKCKSKKGSFSLGKFFSSKNPESNDQTENTGLLEVSCNGVVPAVSIEETLVQIPHTSSVVPDTNTQAAALNINEASIPDKTSKKPEDEPENSPKEEEAQVLIHNSETPESNNQTGSFSLMKFLRSKTPESNHQTGSFSLMKFLRSKIPKSNDQTENSPKKEEEIEVQDHNSETPDSNTQTATASSKDQEVLMSVAETSNESENSPDQVQTSEEIPESGALTENSPKKEEEVQVQIHKSETPESNNPTENSPKKDEEVEVQIHKSETPESNNLIENSPKKDEEVEVQDHRSETPESNTQAATTTSEGQEASMPVAETSNESATDSQDQNTSSNDLQTAASTETEESAETSNGDETTIRLLEARDQSIFVSA